MTRFHEEQRFHGAVFVVLLFAMVLVVAVTVISVLSARPEQVLLLAIAPAVVLLVVGLVMLSHLDVDVDDRGVAIAFRGLWPTRRIEFGEIVGLEISRFRPLIDYGGWGVRLGPAGWAYTTGGDVGVKLRLRKGLPVLIGTRRPSELEAAIRAGVERSG